MREMRAQTTSGVGPTAAAPGDRRGSRDTGGPAAAPLTVRQQRVLTDILDPGGRRPEFPAELPGRLRTALEQGLVDVAAGRGPGDPLRISKYPLRQVLRCEGLFAAEEAADFTWSLANVTGRIVHRAIQRIVTGGAPTTPLDAVEAAIDRQAGDPTPAGLAAFLAGLDAEERTELIQRSSDLVTKFTMDWPPLRRRWVPRIESRTRVRLCDGRVLLTGSVDLALGVPVGRQARSLIVELKSGVRRREDREDLRFYALLETLARGVPPHRVVTYYADEGACDVEDVTTEVLDAAVQRTLAGARRIAAVADGERPAERRSNDLCRWCPALLRCDVGRRHLAARGPTERLSA